MTRYAPSVSRPQLIAMHLCHPSTLTTSCRLSSDNYQPSAFPVRKPVPEPSTWMPVWWSARDRALAGETQGRPLLGRRVPRFKTQFYTKCRDCTTIYIHTASTSSHVRHPQCLRMHSSHSGTGASHFHTSGKAMY